MGYFCRNTEFFEYHIRLLFDYNYPLKVLRFLQKFVDTIDRLDISKMKEYVMLPFLIKEDAWRQFYYENRVGSTYFGIQYWPTTVN